ncbi:hypothetical protein CYMTET_37320 [Cymbomonas tetramitiformis]|uniref:Uncharacterized protein n=1 Tax=Cymbomonas tetramitiformis TaxID=36881 RepID=A0AAE0CFY7_9CHLO|nr:hypothetical protein CYMTET_37320 [Cymbomonas tetramitiformis]
MSETYESSSSSSWKRFLTSYTGAKDEDRAEFIQNLARAVEELRRTHEASLRAKLKSFTCQSLSPEKRAWIRNSWPDYQAMWDLLPTLMQGKDGVLATTVAFSWFMESYEKDGVVASNAWRILKNMEQHGPMKGAIPCGKPPFHERAPGTTWSVAKVFEPNDRDGEESEEYMTEGTSVKGLTGPDGGEESMYYWTLRLFVAELDAKFMLKGGKEKKDLLTSRVQLPGEDGLTYMKACQRREAMVHTGREDITKDMIRQHIEECVDNLRIKVYRTTAKEQLRAQHPPPKPVTWKYLEEIVEVQDNLMNDNSQWILAWRQDISRRVTSPYACWEAKQNGVDLALLNNQIKKHALVKAGAGSVGDQAPEEKKKQPATPVKGKWEAAAGERQKDYSKTPPPTTPKGGQKDTNIYCQYCYGGRQHASNPADCWTGSPTATVPKDFHISRRLNSQKFYEAQNARMRLFNIRYRFPKKQQGVTVAEWKKIPDSEQEALVKDSSGKTKDAETTRAVNLAEERDAMETHLSHSGGSVSGSVTGSVHTQAFSDDECDLECQTRSFAAERPVYSTQDMLEDLVVPRQCLSAEVTGVDSCHDVPGPKASSEVCLDGLDNGAAADIMSLEAKACAEGVEHCAAVAVALGNTQMMQSFPVKTPAEFDEEARVPRAPAAELLDRKLYLLHSHLKSAVQTLNRLTAHLSVKGLVSLPNNIQTLLAVDEAEKLLTEKVVADVATLHEPDDKAEQLLAVKRVADAAMLREFDDDEESLVEDDEEVPDLCSDGEEQDDIPLEEMAEGVVDSLYRAAAACVNRGYGVHVSGNVRDIRAGSIQAHTYELLKKRMESSLSEEMLSGMAQVQPVCKLVNQTLAQGLALVALEGGLMLYKAILMDTGANCNIIAIKRVKELGLAIYEVEAGSKVARCDGTSTAFKQYCYVDVILAAGTPHMTLHRLHAFISYSETTYDFLIGTGPLKNALRVTIDLYRGLAVSEAPAMLLGVDEKVTLPLIECKVPDSHRRRRNADPRVCLTSEIFDRGGMEYGYAAERAEWLDHETPAEQDEQYFDCQEEVRFCAGVGERDPWQTEGKKVTRHSTADPQTRTPEELVEDDDTSTEEVSEDPTDDKYVQRHTCKDSGGSRKRYASRLWPTGRVGGVFADDHTQKLLEEETRWPDSLPHTRCVPLTEKQLAVSDQEFLIAAHRPWKGSMTHCWGDIDEEPSEENGSWRHQRLYTSMDGHQRLCDIVEKINEKETKVKFAHCQQETVVPNDRLRWPDFSSVDQKWDPYGDCTMKWWHSVVPNLGSEYSVVEPDYEALREAGDMKLAELQRSLCERQIYPSGPIVGTLMWDQKVHKFCVMTKPADDALSIAHATLSHSPADCSFAAKLESELQLPHYYESEGCWMYQHLRVLRKVELNLLRQLIYDQYKEVEQGHEKAPKLIIRNNKARGTPKFYPVTDGEGGPGVVFDNYHAAQEYIPWDMGWLFNTEGLQLPVCSPGHVGQLL